MNASPLTAKEITARLAAEGISLEDFVQHCQHPQWLGLVSVVDEEHHEASKHEYANHIVIFHVPAHNLYLRAHGVNEVDDWSSDDNWVYSDGLTECRPHQETSTTTHYY